MRSVCLLGTKAICTNLYTSKRRERFLMREHEQLQNLARQRWPWSLFYDTCSNSEILTSSLLGRERLGTEWQPRML